MKKIILLCFLMMVALPVFAVNWVQIGAKTWLDLSTYITKGNIVSAWVKVLNDGSWKPLNNQKIYYNIIRYNANCSERTFALSASISYDYNKEVVASFDYNNKDFLLEWNIVIPESLGGGNRFITHYVRCRG